MNYRNLVYSMVGTASILVGCSRSTMIIGTPVAIGEKICVSQFDGSTYCISDRDTVLQLPLSRHELTPIRVLEREQLTIPHGRSLAVVASIRTCSIIGEQVNCPGDYPADMVCASGLRAEMRARVERYLESEGLCDEILRVN